MKQISIDIELAKLQAKFSKEQTEACAFVSVIFAGVIGFAALTYSLSSNLSGMQIFHNYSFWEYKRNLGRMQAVLS